MWVGDLHVDDALVYVGVQCDLGGVEALKDLLHDLQERLGAHAPPSLLVMALVAAAGEGPLRRGLC